MSINSVEAAPRNRRAMSTSVSSKSSASSSTETSANVNNNYTMTDNDIENIKYNIFDRSSKNKLYRGISNEAIKLFNEKTYPYFNANMDKFVLCFREDLVVDVKIDGEYILNNSNHNYSCYDNVKEIFIPESVSSSEIIASIYIRNGDFSSDSLIDNANLQIKDVSSLISTDTLKKVKDTCNFKSYYNDIKSLLTASVATSGVATVAGAAGTALNVVELIQDRKEEKKEDSENKTVNTNKKLSSMNIAEIASSGTAAASNMVSAITNFVSLDKINKLSSQMEKCVDASKKLNLELQNIYEEIGDDNGTLNKHRNIVSNCSILSPKGNIETIKGLATASGFSNMVGAAASGASIATNIIGNTSDKVDSNKMNLATSITSGIGTATGVAGTVMSAENLTKIQDLISSLENCTDSIDEAGSSNPPAKLVVLH